MIPSLYEPFKHWASTGSVWLISDPHFADKESIAMNPNYFSAAEPDAYIEMLNKNIHKSDTLICLGDCGDLSYVKKLKAGHKVLIKGNHDDKGDSKYLNKIITRLYETDAIDIKNLRTELKEEFPYGKFEIHKNTMETAWCVTINDNLLFDEVYSGALFIAPQILLSHEPINGLKFCCNIHGHWHEGLYDYTDEKGGRHLNLAADVVQFQPLSLGELIKAGLVAGLPTIHRLAIDKRL